MKITANIKLTRPSGFVLDVDLTVRPRGITALYGPSGSGKSTLLRLLAGLERGKPGDRISVKSDNTVWQNDSTFVPPERRGIGFVFQQQQLFPHLTVQGNLHFALSRQHTQNALDTKQVYDWLNLHPLLDKETAQLSGGEAQRVAFARVLLNGARCILLDEPLGSIDSVSRSRILPYLDRLHRNLQIPMIYVSHSYEEITFLADYLFVLEEGKIKSQGSLLELSSTLELNAPEGESAAAVIQCTVVNHDQTYRLSELDFEGANIYVNAENYRVDDSLRVRIPARDVSIATTRPENSSILNIIAMEVVSFEESKGPGVLVRLRRKRQFILARITRKSLNILKLSPGQSVYAQIKSVALLMESGASVSTTTGSTPDGASASGSSARDKHS
jgi:molybdate transport system ATP-binding protein